MTGFEEIFSTFENFQVKYIVIGGHAMMYDCGPRFTKDIEIFIEVSPENSVRVFEALAQFGVPLAGMTADYFSEPGYVYQMGVPPLRIDVFMSLNGVDFETAWERRVRACLGEIEANVISREDIIASKKASGRPIDLHDVEQLEKRVQD